MPGSTSRSHSTAGFGPAKGERRRPVGACLRTRYDHAAIFAPPPPRRRGGGGGGSGPLPAGGASSIRLSEIGLRVCQSLGSVSTFEGAERGRSTGPSPGSNAVQPRRLLWFRATRERAGDRSSVPRPPQGHHRARPGLQILVRQRLHEEISVLNPVKSICTKMFLDPYWLDGQLTIRILIWTTVMFFVYASNRPSKHAWQKQLSKSLSRSQIVSFLRINSKSLPAE